MISPYYLFGAGRAYTHILKHRDNILLALERGYVILTSAIQCFDRKKIYLHMYMDMAPATINLSPSLHLPPSQSVINCSSRCKLKTPHLSKMFSGARPDGMIVDGCQATRGTCLHSKHHSHTTH